MKRIAEFYKVSIDQFIEDYKKINGIKGELDSGTLLYVTDAYKDLKLPKRATAGSAGYDFFSPFDFDIVSGCSVKFPTGIRCRMKDGWCLMLFTRSSLGLNYRFQLDTGTSIIDADYYYSDNEGHITAKFTNDSREDRTLHIERGKAYMQGVFVKFGITVDDNTTAVRNGGIGSTDKN